MSELLTDIKRIIVINTYILTKKVTSDSKYGVLITLEQSDLCHLW